jgi:hypothetical protein
MQYDYLPAIRHSTTALLQPRGSTLPALLWVPPFFELVEKHMALPCRGLRETTPRFPCISGNRRRNLLMQRVVLIGVVQRFGEGGYWE